MSPRIVASFDIGGTNMRAAVIAVEDGEARILEQTRRPTPNYLLEPSVGAQDRLDDVLTFMHDYARSAQSRFAVQAVAAAFPGPVDASGRITALPTIWGEGGQTLCPLALDRMLEQRLPGVRVRVFNDVTAAGYRFVGEMRDFALFTLGSGVGFKVFIDGVPQVGPHGQGGELTHMVFDPSPNAPLCDCGGRGHLGALASGRAWQRISAIAKEEGHVADLD
ncbi:MAG: ROK family protein, partial [Dokdonella sp.]